MSVEIGKIELGYETAMNVTMAHPGIDIRDPETGVVRKLCGEPHHVVDLILTKADLIRIRDMGDGVEHEIRDEKFAVEKADPRRVLTRNMLVSRMYKEGGVVTREEADESPIEVVAPPADVPMGEVGFEARMTLNLGNYESVQIGVSCTLPCIPGEVEEAFSVAKNFVDLRLNRETDEIRTYRKKKSGDDA